MIGRILLNKNLALKERLKRSEEYLRRRRGGRLSWRKVFTQVFNQNPGLKIHADRSIEKAHKLYWRFFDKNVNLSTLRICKNISGVANYKIIPEEIFWADIEPTLNSTPSVQYLTYKSLYNHWLPGDIFPRNFFHNIEGEWLDPDLNPITINDIRSIAKDLHYPVVFKPNKDSYGGRGIKFPKDEYALLKLVLSSKDFLVQEKIKQHSFFNQFNPAGLNTLRVCVYRSVSDNSMRIVNIALRMGVGGSLDNVSSGGIFTLVREDGSLNGFAVDSLGTKYLKHPDTGVDFNKKVPDFEGLKKLSTEIAHKVFYSRLISLDLCYDAESKWRVIEINILSATISFAQQQGHLFFSGFTDEVHDYCILNHWTLK